MTENQENQKSVFETLNAVDVSDKTKEKNGLTYLPWITAWQEVKKRYPDATYTIHRQIMDSFGNTRFWHDDGKTGWVEVSVTICGLTHTENLAIMDFKNRSIAADQITSVDANKSMKRCFVKAIAMHGLGAYIYSGEEIPEDVSKVNDLQEDITSLAKKKSALSEAAKEKCIELCKKAEKAANPYIEDDLITGKVGNIDDLSVLEDLKRRLMAVRK